jgi:hypothetical protein
MYIVLGSIRKEHAWEDDIEMRRGRGTRIITSFVIVNHPQFEAETASLFMIVNSPLIILCAYCRKQTGERK